MFRKQNSAAYIIDYGFLFQCDRYNMIRIIDLVDLVKIFRKYQILTTDVSRYLQKHIF